MKRSIIMLSLALGALPLMGCTDGTQGNLYLGMSYPYYGYYDGFYGPVYDGYWGTDGYFYYRHDRDDRFRRGDHDHFRRDDHAASGNFHPMQGELRPRRDVHMPHFDRSRGNADHPDRDRPDRDRDQTRDRR